MRADSKLLRENLPVALRLIEHIDEVRVFKDVLNLTGSQQILDVLRQSCGYPAPFTKAFPDFNAVGRSLFLFQKQMKLILVEPSRLF